MCVVRPVCVIGLGLIGGSLLRAASESGRQAWGFTTSTVDAEAATVDGYTVASEVSDALRQAGDQDAIVVIAVPLPAVDRTLGAIAAHAPECVLTDVVSVKSPVELVVRQTVPRTRYVGGHPMAGTTSSGWAAGSAGLFKDASWVLTVEDETDLEAWRDVARLVLDCGAQIVPATAAGHDDAVARISHLPHLLAAVLAAVGADGGNLSLALAAGSYTDGTRVAGTRPELIRAMCEGNRGPLLDAVDDALGRLGAARGALASTGSLGATVEAGHQGWQALRDYRGTARPPGRIDLSAPDARETLLALGDHGGRIVGLDGDFALTG
ncbi:prephenate dehydrogenase [Kibdelosporangium persicum]|uniref:Prephenate dehydrogenase n=1 Tax=Kibdelosporangium persicum TaxID=2698649 RepID=A0ABX2F626_9PSEU|nr:prephenate dehydrogenase [Kibdelosporangium persicum]NRN66347.1 Prephenate dehydrogenase [Kibdelosporangium persicum]